MAGVAALAMMATGCQADGPEAAVSTRDASAVAASSTPSASSSAPAVSAASIAVNVAGRRVAVDRTVSLEAQDGTLRRVSVTAGKKSLAGSLGEDGTTWTARGRLEPGTRYQVRAVAVDADGVPNSRTSTFRTMPLSLDQQTFPSFIPVSGETVGVGMPVIVRFDVPVSDKASIEKHLTVTTTSDQPGAWRWISDNEVHYRPKSYWKPGTDVTVEADVNSIPAGKGVYGQLSRTSTFHVGRSVVSKVNAATHQMSTFIDGRLAKRTPITTGKAGFTTRSGTKVIIEKFRERRMNSETVGIARGSAEAYDIDDVEYAMRLTYSGEFLHAAPWSVGSQGSANVSHGCTGLSTANAGWLYSVSKPGDVVEYTGTDRPMTLDNGYGDWNLPFEEWKKGSALS
ncbi:MAG: Ig-like domain-containing protein [Nocardioidaceae bacterium]